MGNHSQKIKMYVFPNQYVITLPQRAHTVHCKWMDCTVSEWTVRLYPLHVALSRTSAIRSRVLFSGLHDNYVLHTRSKVQRITLTTVWWMWCPGHRASSSAACEISLVFMIRTLRMCLWWSLHTLCLLSCQVTLLVFVIRTLRMCLWWSLYTLCLLSCQVTVFVWRLLRAD